MRKILLSILSLLMILTACSNQNQQSEETPNFSSYYYSFTDDAGNKVELREKPQTVAVLFSSYAEIWEISGGKVDITVQESIDRNLVENDCILVDEKSGHTSIDLERLVASEPDLVIGTADYEIQCETVELCRKNGIPAALFRVETFEDYLETLKIFTDINGEPQLYEEYGLKVGEKIENLLAQISNSQKNTKDILFVRAGTSGKSTKAKTAEDNFVCAMLKELGTNNIAEKAPVLLDGLSLEEIVVSNPEHIFITLMGSQDAATDYMNSVLAENGWNSLTAVQNQNYHYLPKDLFHYKPNHRWYDAYRQLAEILYPEIEFAE